MRNIVLNKFDNTVQLKIKGKNIDRFLNRIFKSKIELLQINKIDRKEAVIRIYEIDYEKLLKIKSIYEVELIGISGISKFKKNFLKNKYLLLLLVVGYFLILTLSNIVFDIQVIHSNSKIRELVMEELNKNGIKKYTFRKSFNELEKITDKILENNKDKLEWMEIEVVGTKIVVKIEERKLNESQKTYPKQNVIAKKSGIIKSIKSKEGVIVKNINDYVSKGDVIISGTIMDTYGENVKDIVSAKGEVYAEVWYTVSMEYPLAYINETLTGKQKNLFKIQFLNKKISVFDFNKYENYKSEEKIIFENKLLPFKILRVKEYETNKEDSVYLPEEALIKAEKVAREKMEEQLKENEKIIKQKNLKFYQKDSKIVVETFFSVYERIDTTEEIKDITELNKDKRE